MAKIRILHLEDDPHFATMVRAILDDFGMPAEIVVVETREDFKRALKDNVFDLILSDHSLPNYDGQSALAYCRRQYPDIPFVFLSGTMGEELAVESLKQGAMDYVLKANMSRLVPTINRTLDVTRESLALRKAQERIRRDQFNLFSLIENASDAIFSVDVDFRVLAFNTHASLFIMKLCGSPLESGVDFLETMPPDEKERWKDAMRRVRKRERFRQERDLRWKDQVTPLEIFFSPILADHEVTGMAVCSRDVTERAEARRDLRSSRDRLNAILDGVAEAVTATGVNGKLVFANEAAARQMGFAQVAELLAASPEEVSRRFEVFREDGSPLSAEEFPTRLAFSGKPSGDVTLRWQPRDGGERPGSWYVVKSIPVLGDDDRVQMVITTSHDITEIKSMELDLLQAKQTAEDSNRSKAQFLTNLSHEIRTPMNGVMGMLKLFSATGLSQKQKDYLRIIQASADGLLTVINGILDFAKIERGSIKLENRAFAVREMMESVDALLRAGAEEKRIELGWEISDSVPKRLRGDEGRLRQILLNLAGNAIKFTEKGGVRIRVDRDPSLAGEVVLRFEVEDTGVGISAEDGRKLFQSFSQAEDANTSRQGGTGLGLFLCKELCALMRGNIGFTSHPGRGSVFKFSVILEEASPSETKSRQAKAAWKLDVDGTEKKLRILVAEDNRVNQMVLVKILERLGCKSEVADDGAKACEACRLRDFDLIFMDCQMPVMDGYEATQVIRGERRKGRVHPWIVALTADVLPGTREKCLDAGMNGYITKPVKVEEVLEVLQRALSPAPVKDAKPTPKTLKANPESNSQSYSQFNSKPDSTGVVVDFGLLARVHAKSLRENAEIYGRLVSEFLGKVQEGFLELNALRNQGHLERFSKAAHALKGASLNFGAVGMARECENLQRLADSGHPETLAETMSSLAQKFELTRTLLTSGPQWIPSVSGDGKEKFA